MIPTTRKYKQELINGNRRYVVKAIIELADNSHTTLTLGNSDIWEQGVVLDNAISSDGSFDIGSAIVGRLSLILDNIDERFNEYDFLNASIVLYMGVENDLDEHDDQIFYRIGFYSVDDTSYNGSLITLECLDNMTWFDVPFSEVTGISYPTTAGQLVSQICSHVGVLLGTPNFQNYTMAITEAPEGDFNCREILQYVAQKCCCYCKIDRTGELALKWYNKHEIIDASAYDGGTYKTTTTPYSDGVELDGGSFNPWDMGDSADGGTFEELQNSAWLSHNYEISVATDEIVITGCRVRLTSGENAYDELWVDTTLEEQYGRYVLVIENNPLITKDEAADVANIVGSILAGLPVRAFTARSLNDLSYETGDMVTIVDFRGNIYYTWITSLTFTINNSENFACGAETIKQRNETRFSESVKTLAEAQQNAKKALSDYDSAVKAMNELAQDALTYKKYEYEASGGVLTWLYNGVNVDDTDPSKPIFTDSTVIFKISGDGVFISDGSIDPDTGEQIYSQGYDANSGTAILNLIYAHGIECDWIHSGTLTLGGSNNINGSLRILNASSQEIGRWDKDGINATTGTFSGNLSGAGGTFSGDLNAAGGTFSGTLSAAKGTMSDNVGTLSLSGGNLYMTNSNSGGAGVFAYQTGGALYACWGADESSSRRNGNYIHTTTWNVIQAGINASDKRLKKNIRDIDSDFAKDLILGIKPKTFKFKKNKGLPSGLQFGVIAQDIQEVEEKHGITEENRLCYEEDDGYLAVEYRQLIAPLMRVVQDQQEQIDELKQELADLKARLG